MSEIKEKITEIIEASKEFNEEVHSIFLTKASYDMLENGLLEMKAFIESNYIPKNDHERSVKSLIDQKNGVVKQSLDKIQKLKEENERLKDIVSNLPDFDATSPSIEDLNKE